MKVSIVTVSYNSAQTILDTLISVGKQDYADIEHIVVDGGSTDGTQSIVESCSSVSRYISESDRGIYDAMNKGYALATGDVVGVLNSDDFYSHDGVISRVAEIMDAEKLDVLFGDVSFFRENRPDHIVRRYRSSIFRPSRIAWGWMPAHPALFLHRRIIERVGCYREDYKIAGDFEMVVRIFQLSGVRYRYIPEVFVNMRIGGVSTSGFKNTFLLNKEVLRACLDNGIYSNYFMLLSKYPFKLLEFMRS